MTVHIRPANATSDHQRQTPRGWVRATLGDVLKIIRGVTYERADAAKEPRDGLIPIIRATNIGDGLDFDDLVYVPSMCVTEDQMLRRGDIVIAASSGSLSVVGKAARLTQDWHGSFGAFCMGLRVAAPVESAFVAYFLGTAEYRHGVSQLAAGSNINNLRRTHIESFSFPLPPPPEQRRIVAKIEELFSDLDAGVTALKRVKANLKRYRASVLKAAVEGRLTEEWRKKNPATEPAAKLLERILAERRAKWEAEQLRKFKEAGKAPPKGWKEKYRLPHDVRQDALPPRPPPEGWTWATVDACAWDVTVGHVGPMKERYQGTGIPFLRSQNVRPLRYDPDGLKYIPEDFHAALAKSRLVGGELLVVRSGNVGEVCVYPKEAGEANCSDLVITRLLDQVLPQYVAVFVASPTGIASVLGKQTGSALPHFNVGAMERSPIPLPPLTEQAVIVAEVDRRLSVTAAIETAIEHGLQRASRLRQAILKRAFEGRLVPQDSTDDLATVLENQIQAKVQATDAPTNATRSASRPRRRGAGV